ncbi:MAG: hypothetical protein Q4A15_08215 [Prevotellaceae bacterium]|nr:hypothetical protein [Prevotellaceae bacterium]
MKNKQLISGGDGFDTQLLYFTCSSLSDDDKYLYVISNRTGSPNVFVHNMETGEERQLSRNENGVLKSYVYFDCTPHRGLGKASICLDPHRNIVYYIQDDDICKVGLDGKITVLNHVPVDRVTAFTHVSDDGRLLCVPMTDARSLDYDPETEGSGLDRRPVYNIDGRVQDENLNSYLCVYDTATGALLYEKRIPKCWITHVQFNPANPEIIMYNHEWSSFDCGIRRMWIYDHKKDEYWNVRKDGAVDWVCHEMWSDDGNIIIYHGGYAEGLAMVGRYNMLTGERKEISLPADYNAYGHFTMDHQQVLCCDGYFKFPEDIKKVWNNSTDNGPDPHKKDGEYISRVVPDWETGVLNWIPLCKHESDWLGQDAHPHPIYNHKGNKIFFNSRSLKDVKVYYVEV